MSVAIATRGHQQDSFSAWVGEELPDIKRCLQCGTCSSLCPLASEMGAGPRSIMALARRGDRDGALANSTIWLCTSCYACTVACPQEIPVTNVMYALKRKALSDGVLPERREVPILAEEFGGMVRRTGRVTESWLLARIYRRAGIHKMFRFAPLGARLLRRGRVGLGVEKIEHRSELARVLDVVATREEVGS